MHRTIMNSSTYRTASRPLQCKQIQMKKKSISLDLLITHCQYTSLQYCKAFSVATRKGVDLSQDTACNSPVTYQISQRHNAPFASLARLLVHRSQKDIQNRELSAPTTIVGHLHWHRRSCLVTRTTRQPLPPTNGRSSVRFHNRSTTEDQKSDTRVSSYTEKRTAKMPWHHNGNGVTLMGRRNYNSHPQYNAPKPGDPKNHAGSAFVTTKLACGA